MKIKSLIAAVIMLIAAVPVSAKDDDGHALPALWKAYYDASLADKPQDQVKALKAIATEASAKRLAWDFYDAQVKLAEVLTSMDWKSRNVNSEQRDRAIERYGEPVMSFYHKHSGWNYIPDNYAEENREQLLKGFHPEFMSRDYHITGNRFGKVLTTRIANDYEYVAWSSYLRRSGSSPDALMAYYDGRYPESALIEYNEICRAQHNRPKLEAFAKKWDGKGVALLAREDILMDRLSELDSRKSTSEEYLALDKDLKSFKAERKAMSRKEPEMSECCDQARWTIESLEAKSISFNADDGVLTVRVRNLGEAKVRISLKDKTVFESTLVNKIRSFHVEDTLRMDLPMIDDGSYEIECSSGKVKEEGIWDKYTISLATRTDMDGQAAFAADYRTGKPIPGYENGFVSFSAKDDRHSVSYTENGIIRKSEELALYSRATDPNQLQERTECMLITDRAAFNPDETVRFKAFLFRKGYSLRPVEARTFVTARLSDPQGRVIAEKSLFTDEFGSVDGEFVLVRSDRNGAYRLSILDGSRVLADRWIQVDDFVLPDFSISFDNSRDTFHPGDTVKVTGTLRSYSGHSMDVADMRYTVSDGRENWEKKLEVRPDGHFCISFPTPTEDRYQYYRIMVKVVDGTGETSEFSYGVSVYGTAKEDEGPKEYYFKDVSNANEIGIQVVAGKDPIWGVVELYGMDGKILERKMIHGSTTVSYPHKASYPEAISLSVLYFQNGHKYSYTVDKVREDHRYDMPMNFTRFLDKTLPGESYKFEMQTLPDASCTVTIYDKSTDSIQANPWDSIRPYRYRAFRPQYNFRPGKNISHGPILYKTMANSFHGPMLMSRAVASIDMADAVAVEECAAAAAGSAEEISIRENFAKTVAWLPSLRSDADGRIEIPFTNADKLSTFYVQLFALDRKMRNDVLRREMIVSLPVQINLVEPQYLYRNDTYTASVTLSNSSGDNVSGTVSINGRSGKVCIPAHSSIRWAADVRVPEGSDLELTAAFISDRKGDGSDAVKVKIPVLEPSQTITEAHSGILFSGMDRDALIARLRSEFRNMPGEDARIKEISILDMIKEAIPEEFGARSDNSISQVRSIYASALAGKIGSKGLDTMQLAEAISKILACRNEDGGFGWFSGMNSSPIVTAVILEYLAGMEERGLDVPAEIAVWTSDAIHYLDKTQFEKGEKPYWRGYLSIDQYLSVRSRYLDVECVEKVPTEFRKAAKAYLLPGRKRDMNGQILAKARRIRTLLAFSEAGKCSRRMERSALRDLESISQYAIRHRDGGIYFPNAVMPWRGLMESELYAHSMLCDLLSKNGYEEIAEGIRLWIMLQKETQEWKSDPAFVEALASVLEGSEATLGTKVIALSGEFRKPFDEIQATGNGFSISRRWYRMEGGKKAGLISEGDSLKVGQTVTAEYVISNDENRSFVVVEAPRPACMRPVAQTSGHCGWNCYRNVRKESTEFWFDSYPEEESTIEEVFHVTQEGTFHSPVMTIESTYAPHYRANSGQERSQFFCLR